MTAGRPGRGDPRSCWSRGSEARKSRKSSRADELFTASATSSGRDSRGSLSSPARLITTRHGLLSSVSEGRGSTPSSMGVGRLSQRPLTRWGSELPQRSGTTPARGHQGSVASRRSPKRAPHTAASPHPSLHAPDVLHFVFPTWTLVLISFAHRSHLSWFGVPGAVSLSRGPPGVRDREESGGAY